MDTIGISLDSARYSPDPREPVDRWFQARNASNAQTTASILDLLSGGDQVVVVDPFAGGGSTASAARLRNLPFHGIEHDPLLACVCLAKSQGRLRHVPLLPSLDDIGQVGRLPEALAEIAARVDPADVPVVSALTVVAALRAERGEPVSETLFAGDLGAMPTSAPPGRVVCGDATTEQAWAALNMPRAATLVYTSPPFGPSSPTVKASPELRAGAASVFAADGTLTQSSMPSVPGSFLDLTVQMLHRLVDHAGPGRVVIEHEPDDEGWDSTEALVDKVRDGMGGVLQADTLDRYDSFSPRGPFTLVSFRIRKGDTT